jgi:dynein heavy chain
MQDRHWGKLERTTQKKIDHNSPKFCFEDLVCLHLYKYADEVNEIVEGAQKENKIELNIGKIAHTWDDQNFEFKTYKDTYVLGSMEMIIEFVETQSMELMGMMAQKEVEEFKDNVTKWQRTLKSVDSVIAIWTKVQKNWQRLEPIFLASEDIRAQLPEDTKRFEKVDQEWKALMDEAQGEPGVVMAATADGREELLQTFLGDIDLCEKALSEYL